MFLGGYIGRKKDRDSTFSLLPITGHYLNLMVEKWRESSALEDLEILEAT